MTWLQTYHGHKVDLLEPATSAIDIRDIAHSLAMLPRYTGHLRYTYSVAEHSFWVARLVERWSSQTGKPSRALLLAALLHDAHEAYTGDNSRPFKQAIRRAAGVEKSAVDVIEERLQTTILTRFDRCVGNESLLDKSQAAIISDADHMMLAIEHAAIVPESEHAWESVADVDGDDLHTARNSLRAEWPQELFFPVGGGPSWESIFLLEFARLTGQGG